MSNDLQFYRNQASTQRDAAAEATLDNVRERCERAAASWEAMANRAERVVKLRSDREAPVLVDDAAAELP